MPLDDETVKGGAQAATVRLALPLGPGAEEE